MLTQNGFNLLSGKEANVGSVFTAKQCQRLSDNHPAPPPYQQQRHHQQQPYHGNVHIYNLSHRLWIFSIEDGRGNGISLSKLLEGIFAQSEAC